MGNNKNMFIISRFIRVSVLCAFSFVMLGVSNLFAQTAMVTDNFVVYPDKNHVFMSPDFQCRVGEYYDSSGTLTTKELYRDHNNRSFESGNTYIYNYNGQVTDPWAASALIEYDNVHLSTSTIGSNVFYGEICSDPTSDKCKQLQASCEDSSAPGTPCNQGSSSCRCYSAWYPNHCLTLCAEITCSNPVRQVEMSVGSSGSQTTAVDVESGDFPIQTILFDIFKYQSGANPYSPDSTPPIRTIAMYPTDGKNVCKGVPTYCTGTNCDKNPEDTKSCCNYINCGSTSCYDNTGGCSGVERFSGLDACKAGLTKLHFCTSWDGSYEIDGEFGKSNGQFGYRTTIKTNYPGDGVSIASDVNIEHMIVYPGDSQIPIQVDVTNVHSVRSSPTLVGKSPAVISQPYRIRYRLSKDATTMINIIDPSELGNGGEVVRHLVKGQPRDGEGFQGGAQSDIQITNEDAWDGRDDEGRLLPYGNYLVSIQSVSQDEWTGKEDSDLSRAVTRQLSLDPLKITNIVASGLNKQSTNYAMLSYMLTEAATVHLEIYTPGTHFGDLNIGGGTYEYVGPTYTTSTASNGLRIASYVEQKEGRVGVNNKWDGMCWDEDNCQSIATGSSTTATGYSYGGAVPDGDYVYLLWAEIPYGSSSGSTGVTYSDTRTVNGITWDGVKTHMIYNGILPVNRGYPEITIDAVSYSTIGSSPTASGLDPFVFSYSLSRDSYVDMGIYTTAASGTATSGSCNNGECAPYLVKKITENEVKEALTKNTYYWDGINDLGRYVSSGTYMLRITAKDSLFPAKMVTRTIEFPVDMFRIVDVSTTPLLESSSGALKGLAGISYSLSKSMDTRVRIYSTGIVIPTGKECPWPPVEQDGTITDYKCAIHDENAPMGAVHYIKEFKGTRQGEGYIITDFWDGYSDDASGSEMVEDGLYPYVIIASAGVAGVSYYEESVGKEYVYPTTGTALKEMYASDRPSGYITVSRGPVYFNNIKINATKPTQYYSSATIELAPYEIQFSVNRVSSVTIEVISTTPGVCMGTGSSSGTICRTLTETNFTNGTLQENMVYDANVINTLYWDGKDSDGKYVRTANYQIKFTGLPYLNNGQVDSTLNPTIENRSLSVNNFQVFDRYIWDVSQQNKEQGKFAFQVSVPMKTAIQIYKPGTVVSEYSSGTLKNPIIGSTIVYSTNTQEVLVKSIVGVRPNLVGLEEIWDGTDYAGQKVPDGIYPFRYVTVLNSYEMNSITGDPIQEYSTEPIADIVMDWDKYINMGIINVANGDSWYADIDWKSNQVTMFYPNPMVQNEGFFEITKVPAPGTVSIKIYNIAGDLVRDSGYDCVNAIGTRASLEDVNNTFGGLSPDWNEGTLAPDPSLLGSNGRGRNFALRCKWDRKNNAGKQVARGLYYAIMTLEPTRGNAKKSQKVIKILIP